MPYFDGTYVVVEAENFTVAPGGWSPKARPAMRSEVIFLVPPPALGALYGDSLLQHT